MKQRKIIGSVFAITFAVLIWFQPGNRSVDSKEQLVDRGYKPETIRALGVLNPSELAEFLSIAPPSHLSNLIHLFLADKKIDTSEKKILDLISRNNQNKVLSNKQAEFFNQLVALKDFETFFLYQIPFEKIDSLKFSENLFKEIPVEFYEVNSDKIPILMYHSIDEPKNWIDESTFKLHLEKLYNAGFSSMKIEDYINGDFSTVPEGRKPVIITFDDEWGSQFYYSDEKRLIISPSCAVGILEDFAKTHPLFGKNALFYLFFHRLPFIQYNSSHLWQKKIKYLAQNGFELGCHTFDHSIMTKMSEKRIRKELDDFFKILKPLLPNQIFHTMTLAYPGGAIPIKRNAIEEYQFEGHPLIASLTAWGGFAKIPATKNPDKHAIPRIEGTSQNINWIIQTATFQKKSKKIQIPKILIQNEALLVKYVLEQKLNSGHPFILFNEVLQ